MDKPLKIFGVLAPTKEHKKMMTVYNACVDAGVDPPDSVLSYLKDRHDDFLVDITEKVTVEGGEFIIDLSDIPKGCKLIKISLVEQVIPDQESE